jgi:hypothetical protein
MEDDHKIKNLAIDQLPEVNDAKVLDLAKSATKYKQLTEAWRELSAQYAAIIEAFDGSIYICSQNYEIEFMNQNASDAPEATLWGKNATKPCMIGRKFVPGAQTTWYLREIPSLRTILTPVASVGIMSLIPPLNIPTAACPKWP